MCTISFIPTASGFHLAMNRDEKRSRVAALPPAPFRMKDRRVICAREPGGGTWLAVNDAGLCLAIINWHRIESEPAGKIESRGRIIPELIGQKDCDSVARQLQRIELQTRRPFRLIVVDAVQRSLTEWQWNSRSLKLQPHPWERRHWYSSGYDERGAEEARAAVCATRWLGTLAALRKLHASHLPGRGPLSICMHRPDAATVSYSEVVVSGNRITLRYQPGAPCQKGPRIAKRL